MLKCVYVSEITVFQYCVLITESLECPCLENLSNLKVNIFHWFPSWWASGTLTEMRECLKVRVWRALRGLRKHSQLGPTPGWRYCPRVSAQSKPLSTWEQWHARSKSLELEGLVGQWGNRCFEEEGALAEGNAGSICRVPFLGSFPKIWPTP